MMCLHTMPQVLNSCCEGTRKEVQGSCLELLLERCWWLLFGRERVCVCYKADYGFKSLEAWCTLAKILGDRCTASNWNV